MPVEDDDDLYDGDYEFVDDDDVEEYEVDEDSDSEVEEESDVDEKPKKKAKRKTAKSATPKGKPSGSREKKKSAPKKRKKPAPQEEAAHEEEVAQQPAADDSANAEADEYGRSAPVANYVVHVYELKQYKRTIDRVFTPEEADAVATEYNRTAKNYNRFAVPGKADVKPGKELAP